MNLLFRYFLSLYISPPKVIVEIIITLTLTYVNRSYALVGISSVLDYFT
nr:MAG TPA: hypothetical protein [Caudoviricetes sp.]